MAKFHINKNGVPAPCHAKEGNCPLGGNSGNENHFNNLEDAQKAANEINSQKFGILGGVEPKERIVKFDVDFSDYDLKSKIERDQFVTDVGYEVTRGLLQKNNIDTDDLDIERGDGNLHWKTYHNSLEFYDDLSSIYEDTLSEDEEVRDRQLGVIAQVSNFMEHLDEEAKNSDVGEDVISNTEKALNKTFKKSNFKDYHKKNLIKQYGESVKPENVNAAADFLKFAMTDKDSHKYFNPEVSTEEKKKYIEKFAKKSGYSKEDLNHWTTKKALDVAEDYYSSPLSSTFSGNERRAEEAARELRDWVGYDFK